MNDTKPWRRVCFNDHMTHYYAADGRMMIVRDHYDQYCGRYGIYLRGGSPTGGALEVGRAHTLIVAKRRALEVPV